MTDLTFIQLYCFIICTITLCYLVVRAVKKYSRYSEQKKLDEWKSFRDQALTEPETTTDTTTS